MKLLVHGCPMKDDSLPLSSYGISLPPPGPPSPPEDDSFRARGRRSGFLSGLWPSILENSKPPPVFKIRMIGSTATKAVVSDRPDLRPPAPTEKPATAPAPTEAVGAATVLDERSLATQITDLVDEAKRTLGPQVDELESSLAPPAPRSPRNSLTPPPAPAAMAKTLSGSSTPLHVYLSEMLLQRLLKLDSFSVPADWTAARAARKEGVRTIQTYLGGSRHTGVLLPDSDAVECRPSRFGAVRAAEAGEKYPRCVARNESRPSMRELTRTRTGR